MGFKLGLVGLFVSLGFGMFLEFLLFLDAPFYVNDSFLRHLWSLAHAHGTLAWLVYLVLVPQLDRLEMNSVLRRTGRACCGLGAVFLPLGFLLGALGHGVDRPSWPIVLVPLGGSLLGAAVLMPVVGARESQKNGNQSRPGSVSPS